MNRVAGFILAATLLGLTARADPPAVIVPQNAVAVPYALGAADGKKDQERWEWLRAEMSAVRRELSEVRTALGVKDAKKRDAQIAEVLVARCASCHTAPEGKGGLDLFTASGDAIPYDRRRWAEIQRSVLQGTMPKGKALDASDKALFDK